MKRPLQWFALALVCLGLSAFHSPARSLVPEQLASPESVRVYLNPDTGRFWTADSYEGSRSDPLSLHKYVYARNNPVNRIDPSGHESLLSLSIATSIGMSLRLGYDATTTAAGAAIQKTIFGVQAGKDAEAIITEYVTETLVGAAIGYGVFKVLGRAFDLQPSGASAAESELFPGALPFRPKIGTKVYRVYVPGRNQWDGKYWTTVDPRKVANYSDAAGLPVDIAKAIREGRAKVVVGEIMNNEGIEAAAAVNSARTDAASRAAALEGIANRGGLLELRIQDAASTVRRIDEVPLQQWWGF